MKSLTGMLEAKQLGYCSRLCEKETVEFQRQVFDV